MSFMFCVYNVTHSCVNLATCNLRNVQNTILIRVTTKTTLSTTHFLKSNINQTKPGKHKMFLSLDFVSNYSTHVLACGLPHMPGAFFSKTAKFTSEEFRMFSSEDSFAEKSFSRGISADTTRTFCSFSVTTLSFWAPNVMVDLVISLDIVG